MSDPINSPDMEETAEIISGETMLSSREVEALLRAERHRAKGHNPRTRHSVQKKVAEEMGIEPTTVQTLQDRASKKAERAHATIKFQDTPENYVIERDFLESDIFKTSD